MQSLYTGTPAAGTLATAESPAAGTSAAEKIKVLVAHENSLISAGLQSALSADAGLEVLSFEGSSALIAPEALARAANVVITGSDAGIDVVSALPRSCRVLIVTADESEVSIRRAMEQGIAGYLLLTCSREALIRAVRRIRNGSTELDAVVASKIAASLSGPALSPRETEVLRYLMTGVSDKAIARMLGRSVGTAKSHVKAILAKLGTASRTEAAAVARRRGLVPAAGDPAAGVPVTAGATQAPATRASRSRPSPAKTARTGAHARSTFGTRVTSRAAGTTQAPHPAF